MFEVADLTGDSGVRRLLTTWMAIAAIALCPLFCLGDMCGGVPAGDSAPRVSCCPHCCGGDASAEDDPDDQDVPCRSDCLCKGALPVKLPVELPPPAANDVLPVAPDLAERTSGPGNTEWNRRGSPLSLYGSGRGLRIALCSFLC